MNLLKWLLENENSPFLWGGLGIFLIILLIYQFIKKRIMKDDKNELESLKLLQELLEKGTINEDEFEKKKNKIVSKW